MRTDHDHQAGNTESLIAEPVSVSSWNRPGDGKFYCAADADGNCQLPPEADGIGAALRAIHAELASLGWILTPASARRVPERTISISRKEGIVDSSTPPHARYSLRT
jgi:hypothetical protein